MKRAGILCPISCLPGKQGIGDFGKDAYQFCDLLAKAKVKVWQILPLNPLAYGNSPYQPYSSFAGDEIYLDCDAFIKEKLLKRREIQSYRKGLKSVNYDSVRPFKEELYRLAYSRFIPDEDYRSFCERNSWLEGYAVYRVFKKQNGDKEWLEWEEEYRNYPEISFSLVPFEKELSYHKFLQYYFYKQWMSLKAYANKKGLMIIGDMPIYVGMDSADVWLNKENFLLEEDGSPAFVAGVPPDYFSKFGQRWGNPIYNWEYLQTHDFDFWIQRLSYACQLYDVLRIDHFRGFDTYWKIPSDEPTAIIGTWEEAPGYALFDTLFAQHPECHILAEDLGDLRDEVYQLRDRYHFKGMYVYEFHHHVEYDFSKVVAYTGTHDNDTLIGWYNSLEKDEKKDINKQLKPYQEKSIAKKAIHYCMDLESETVIIPVWDLLELTKKSRFNVPGTIGSPNWEWRMADYDALKIQLKDFKKMIVETQREE